MENKYCNLRYMTKIDYFFVELNLKLMDSLYIGSIGTIKDKTQLIFWEAEILLILSKIEQ